MVLKQMVEGVIFGPFLKLYTKMKSKWIKDLNLKAKIGKCLEENIGANLLDLGVGKDFLRHKELLTHKLLIEVVDKLYNIEIKNCFSENIIKIKTHLRLGTNAHIHIFDKGLASRIHESSLRQITKLKKGQWI